MPKFLFEVSYSADGIQGIRTKGPAVRRQAAEDVAKSLGGALESFYFAFGAADAFVTCDLPDNEAAAAVALAVSAGGSRCKTVALLTVEQMEAAVSRDVKYSPPGS